jgi:hypothetical protein
MASVHWSDQVVSIFETLHADLSNALAALSADPMPGSPGEGELRSAELREHILTAFAQSSLLIEAAQDHLTAFVISITQPALTVSPWTSVRGVLETSAVSRWLLEPEIGAQVRTARAFQFRYAGLSQQLKFARVASEDSHLLAIDRHLAEVLEHASSHGSAVKRGSDGSPKSLADTMPKTTDLVQRYLHEEAAYRLLSALAHGHPWALQELSFGALHEDEPHLLEKALSIRSIAYLGSLGLKASEAQLKDKGILFAWPLEAISESYRKATLHFARVVKNVDSARIRPA